MLWWKTVPKVGAGNWKSLLADVDEVERRYGKFVEGTRPDRSSLSAGMARQ